jgi:hypothetical protein
LGGGTGSACSDGVKMAPRDGFEPPARRLTAACSTAELPGTRAFNTIRDGCIARLFSLRNLIS